jgi:hypothetical protein
MRAKTVAWRNTGLWRVRPAGMLPASPDFSEVKLRWAQTLGVYVPFVAQDASFPFPIKTATRNGRATIRVRSPDVHLFVRRAHHRTIIRQIERFLKFH